MKLKRSSRTSTTHQNVDPNCASHDCELVVKDAERIVAVQRSGLNMIYDHSVARLGPAIFVCVLAMMHANRPEKQPDSGQDGVHI